MPTLPTLPTVAGLHSIRKRALRTILKRVMSQSFLPTGGPVRYITAQTRRGCISKWEQFHLGIRLAQHHLHGRQRRSGRPVKARSDSSDKVEVLTERIAGSASCTPDGTQCVLLKTSPERPAEVYLHHKGTEKQLTHLQDGVAALPRFQSEVIRWKASDGLALEGILWLPVNYRAGYARPAFD